MRVSLFSCLLVWLICCCMLDSFSGFFVCTVYRFVFLYLCFYIVVCCVSYVMSVYDIFLVCLSYLLADFCFLTVLAFFSFI